MGRIKRTGQKPEMSKYQQKLAARRAADAVERSKVTPIDEPVALPNEWEVAGNISQVVTKGYCFMETDRQLERVYVRLSLLPKGSLPQEQDRLRCRVFRNEHGLRARDVLEYRPRS